MEPHTLVRASSAPSRLQTASNAAARASAAARNQVAVQPPPPPPPRSTHDFDGAFSSSRTAKHLRRELQSRIEERRAVHVRRSKLIPGGPSKASVRRCGERADRAFQVWAEAACRSHYDLVPGGLPGPRAPRGISEPDSEFTRFRTKFFEHHRAELTRQWRAMHGVRPVRITKLAVAPKVQERFVADAASFGDGALDVARLRPVWHGTPARNIRGISRKGLCVPGGASGVPVANGQVYGRGVYTATTPTTPRYYAQDGHMLLAAVVDDTAAPRMREGAERPQPSQSRRVKHCGNGYVVVRRDESIVPLFDLEFTDLESGHGGHDVNFADASTRECIVFLHAVLLHGGRILLTL